MCYPSSENKGADQLRGYLKADLRLCFRICRLLVFSRGGSYVVKLNVVSCVVISFPRVSYRGFEFKCISSWSFFSYFASNKVGLNRKFTFYLMIYLYFLYFLFQNCFCRQVQTVLTSRTEGQYSVNCLGELKYHMAYDENACFLQFNAKATDHQLVEHPIAML